MALTVEWRQRIEFWLKALKKRTYHQLQTVEMSGFVTMDQLTAEQTNGGDFKPMPVGTKWGSKWQYAWFKCELVTPEEAAGKRVVFDFGGGGIEALIFVNGRPVGSQSAWRQPLTLTMSGKAGKKFDILVEAYGDHGPRVCEIGPIADGDQSVPEPPQTQQEVKSSSIGIWEEEIYQLWLDVVALQDIRDNIDCDSLQVVEIDEALRDFAVIVDPELPYDEMMETVSRGRERLKGLLECVNGSTVPTMFAFGHGHLDVAWLWPLAETERKAARTLTNQLALAEEYPGYRFMHSQPHLFRMVRERYPALYERIKKAVKAGQIIAEGGMWVEADTNITGGESLIRQFIHGLRFVREEFGLDNEMLWLPDVFGYTGALPQIMAGCGIKYFSTQKIFWNYKGGEDFPYNNFTWEGIDGSEVLVHLHTNYNSPMNPAIVIKKWKDRVQKDGMSTRMMPFGFGDGGGGPTRDHLEFANRQKNLEGSPRVELSGPIEFFKDLEKRGFGDNRYVGELYFQCHRGTYTSQAKTKLGNRKSELALREAEMWSIAAGGAGFAFPAEKMDDAWKKVLLNQFHDIIPGSSIARVYAEAEAAYEEVIATAGEVADSATAALTDDTKAMTVFNSLSWDRKALVELPEGFDAARLAGGEKICVQKVDGKKLVEVTIPSCGWTTVVSDKWVDDCGKSCGMKLIASADTLENELLRVKFNEYGEIVSIFDKESSRELAAGKCNSFKLYKDVPSNFDAWDIDSIYVATPVELAEKAKIEVVTSGVLAATLRITRKLNNSTMTQEVTLGRNSRRVDFKTSIDWQEKHKLLKVAFPVDYHANEAVHEIQFGYVCRPNHYSRQYDQDRYEVCNHKYSALVEANRGFAILNDCKYGLNVLGNSINLTLLRAPQAPAMNADCGVQKFTYSFHAWNGTFFESDVVRQGYELNCPATTASGAGGEKSLFSLDAANVIIETVKPAEDGSGDCIVRLYEAKKTATRCTLTTSLPVKSVGLTDMLENAKTETTCEGGKISLDFGPFEIKTLRLSV